MSRSNYLVTYGGGRATLSACIKGKFIPLISSEDKLRIENIYHIVNDTNNYTCNFRE